MFERGFREREREGRVREGEGRDERGEEKDCDKNRVNVLENYTLAKSKRILKEYLVAATEGTEHGWYGQDYRINNNLMKQDTDLMRILLKSCGVDIYDYDWDWDGYTIAIKSCISKH